MIDDNFIHKYIIIINNNYKKQTSYGNLTSNAEKK